MGLESLATEAARVGGLLRRRQAAAGRGSADEPVVLRSVAEDQAALLAGVLAALRTANAVRVWVLERLGEEGEARACGGASKLGHAYTGLRSCRSSRRACPPPYFLDTPPPPAL